MGSIFKTPKINYAPASEDETEEQKAVRERNEASAREEEDRLRREREAFTRGLRGSRALLTAGQTGFSMPTTLGGR